MLESLFRNSICNPGAIESIEEIINFLYGFFVGGLDFLKVLFELFECHLMLGFGLSQLSDLSTCSFMASDEFVELLV